MKTIDFDYDLPGQLIAQSPLAKREDSRMMVCGRSHDDISHQTFSSLADYLHPGDVLVLNQSRVIPARLLGIKEGSQIACEVLLLKRCNAQDWEALVKPGRRLPVGTKIHFGQGEMHCQVLANTDFGGRLVRFFYHGVFEEILDRLGQMPLPPYIHEQLEEKERYQTVYAKEDGSAAAPTAGLHFTKAILNQLQEKKVLIAPLVLHVGLGTFRPVKSEDLQNHHMHAEWYDLPEKSAEIINQARASGGRIISVGTTSLRTLETLARPDGTVRSASGWTDIFITPGHRFRAVDVLLTNFHLPQSTLLMLVSAFMGRERALAAYQQAVEMQYRFFSFGDCMLIGDHLSKGHPVECSKS